jgi:hypothetical protein
MTVLSYRIVKLMLSLAVTVATAWGCSTGDPEDATQPAGNQAVIEFRTVGTGYRGESLQRPDGQIESRPASPKKEATNE